MSTMNISLPDTMRSFVEQRIAQEGYSTASEYIHQLIREDQQRQAGKRLEAMLLQGLSGESIEVSDAWWEEKKAKLAKGIIQALQECMSGKFLVFPST